MLRFRIDLIPQEDSSLGYKLLFALVMILEMLDFLLILCMILAFLFVPIMRLITTGG